MKKRNSLLKNSILFLGAIEIFNKVIDSASIASSNRKTGGKYYHWKHGNIYYHVYGEKGNPPLLLVHDLTVGSSSYEWQSLAKKLTDTYRVYTVDLIGCGKSDKPEITYTNYLYVQLITDFVTEVIGQSTDIAATGLSTSFVLLANALNQDLFDQIMLVSPTHLSELKKVPDQRSQLYIHIAQLPIIGKALYYAFTNHFCVDRYLSDSCFFDAFHMDASITKAYYNAAHSQAGKGKYLFASQLGNYLYADVSRALAAAKNRIILVTGAQDKEADALIEDYLAVQPNLVLESISVSKHLPQLECEDEMLELLHIF